MSKFKISVVTPYHNVNEQAFSACWNSMLNQSIGFKNIEWIIVLHNCTKDHISKITKLAKPHKNVVVKILDDNHRSPAAPRNHGLKFVTSKYVGHLDGDDSYTPNCLELALKEIINSKAQILSFRREHEMENETLVPVFELLAWNQAEDKIIIDRKNCDPKILYAETFYMVTSKIFLYKFIVDNNIQFDEENPVVEDFLYMIECFEKVKKICFLPQFIGYHYYINSGTMAQHSLEGDDEILAYARAVKKAIDYHKKYKISTDASMGLCRFISNKIIKSNNISKDARKKIKKILGPYVNMFWLEEPNKMYTQKNLLTRYWIPKLIIGNPDFTKQDYVKFMQDSYLDLLTIVKDNRKTDFGKKHNFENIQNVYDFTNNVPLQKYESFAPIIKLQTNIGESEILITKKPLSYVQNTNGQIHMLTKEHLEPYISAFHKMFSNKKTFFIGRYSNAPATPTNDGKYIKNLRDSLLKEYFWNAREGVYKNIEKFTSPEALYFMDIDSKEFYIQLFTDALMCQDLEQIFAFEIDEVLLAFNMLKKLKKEIISNLNKKKTKRSKEVVALLKRGIGHSTLSKIWPNLNLVIATNTSNSSKKIKTLNSTIGKIDHNNGYYFSEDAIVGLAYKNNSNLYIKAEGNNYIELLSSGKTSGKTISFSNARVGNKYHFVVTNSAGMYRLISNHEILIKNKLNGTIIYKILR